MTVVGSMPDQNGTVFTVKEKITPEVENKLTANLKKHGDFAPLEDDHAFLVIHDEEVSFEEIKKVIEEINIF